MTRPDIDAIRERCEKATEADDDYRYYGGPDPVSVQGYREQLFKMARQYKADATALLARIEAVEGLVREYAQHTWNCELVERARLSLFSHKPSSADAKCTCDLTARLAELGLEQ